MALLTTVIVLICALPLLFVLFSKWRYSYWKRRGVVQLNPEMFYGDLREMLTGRISIGEAFKNLYFAFKNKNVPYGGAYWALKPQFVPVDLDLIKNILLKNFSHFQDRGAYQHENDVLTQNMFRIGGEAWRRLRVKLSPTFTSSRLKMMFETLLEKVDGFERVLERSVREGGRLNVTDVTARYTTDVIGSCAFGIECDSLRNPDCDFRVYGKKINQPRLLKQWMENTFPRRLLGYTGFRSFPEVEAFFRGVVMETIEHREKNQVFRKDFMHLLLQLRNRGVISDDGKLTKDKNETGVLTDDEILAQCFIFFAAGFDTSSATMAFAMYELAKNPDVQDQTREEIRQVSKKCGGVVTYEGAKDLVLTERVLMETLRKYPILPFLPRVCTRTFKIPDSNVVLEKGTSLLIPMWGIHMDPQYYPDPERFDPNRFTDEEKAKRPDFTYFPFGEGPRVCIGARFGLVQSKVGLAALLKDYKYSLFPESPEELAFKPALILLHSTKEIWLKVEKAENP